VLEAPDVGSDEQIHSHHARCSILCISQQIHSQHGVVGVPGRPACWSCARLACNHMCMQRQSQLDWRSIPRPRPWSSAPPHNCRSSLRRSRHLLLGTFCTAMLLRHGNAYGAAFTTIALRLLRQEQSINRSRTPRHEGITSRSPVRGSQRSHCMRTWRGHAVMTATCSSALGKRSGSRTLRRGSIGARLGLDWGSIGAQLGLNWGSAPIVALGAEATVPASLPQCVRPVRASWQWRRACSRPAAAAGAWQCWRTRSSCC